jgi:hypothetical protein
MEERQTLRFMGWIVGSIVFTSFVLGGLALP